MSLTPLQRQYLMEAAECCEVCFDEACDLLDVALSSPPADPERE